ncbi:uncharacterized protein TNCV_1946901 [Trichonephila clavipes]|nr:uncharacterized protein TNCV_1946901 [Trichonephila clavipes]
MDSVSNPSFHTSKVGKRMDLFPHNDTRLSPIPSDDLDVTFRSYQNLLFLIEKCSGFLESIDNNLTFYEISTNLASTYLKGHLVGRVHDWFKVIGYTYVQGTATDFERPKKALSENFPEVKNRWELEMKFFFLIKL